eukprot:6192872-Pleurochrysis_carterae.AAC.2
MIISTNSTTNIICGVAGSQGLCLISSFVDNARDDRQGPSNANHHISSTTAGHAACAVARPSAASIATSQSREEEGVGVAGDGGACGATWDRRAVGMRSCSCARGPCMGELSCETTGPKVDLPLEGGQAICWAADTYLGDCCVYDVEGYVRNSESGLHFTHRPAFHTRVCILCTGLCGEKFPDLLSSRTKSSAQFTWAAWKAIDVSAGFRADLRDWPWGFLANALAASLPRFFSGNMLMQTNRAS